MTAKLRHTEILRREYLAVGRIRGPYRTAKFSHAKNLHLNFHNAKNFRFTIVHERVDGIGDGAVKEVFCIHSRSKAVQAPACFSESEEQRSTGGRQMSTWNTNAGRKGTSKSRQDR